MCTSPLQAGQSSRGTGPILRSLRPALIHPEAPHLVTEKPADLRIAPWQRCSSKSTHRSLSLKPTSFRGDARLRDRFVMAPSYMRDFGDVPPFFGYQFFHLSKSGKVDKDFECITPVLPGNTNKTKPDTITFNSLAQRTACF